MEQDRRHVAIMFTDIVGYTSLMGSNEELAVETLYKNREIHASSISRFNGNLIKEIGDGHLVTFNLASDAVHCAIDLQKACLEQNIPLKIGIHEGEILIEKGDIIGDSVNIASRLQDNAVKGSILISATVHQDIRNKSEIQTQYLGQKQLKNVSEPLNVYSITGYHEQGRNEKPSKIHFKRKRNVSFWVIAGIIVALIALFYWFYPSLFNTTDKDISESFRHSRVAVLPYTNNTNDKNLDVVEDMAMDWIIQGLMNIEDMKVVGYETIKDYARYADQTGAGFSGSSFISHTGADRIIKGNFYLQDGLLTFQTQIVNANTGDIELILPVVTGPTSNPMKAIHDLQQRLITVFTAEDDDLYKYFIKSSPKYEAYELLFEARNYFGEDYPKSQALLGQSIREDTTFYTAYVWLALSYVNQGQSGRVDSVLQLIDRRFEKLNKRQATTRDLLGSIRSGDYQKAYEMSKMIYEKDQKGFTGVFWLSTFSSVRNLPSESLAACDQYDFKILTFSRPYEMWLVNIYFYNLIRYQRNDDAYELLEIIPEKIRQRDIQFGNLRYLNFYAHKGIVFVEKELPDSINVMMQSLRSIGISPDKLAGIELQVARRYKLKKNNASKIQWAEKAISELAGNLNKSFMVRNTLAQSYYHAGRLDQALSMYQELFNDSTSNLDALSYIGIIQAKQGNNDQTMEVISKLQSNEHPMLIAVAKYAMAKVYANLNMQEEALVSLKTAFNLGMFFGEQYYDQDPELISLHGYGPFDEFVRPK